jgi:peptidoglycan/LPS O-acetylase OafA/YrhL
MEFHFGIFFLPQAGLFKIIPYLGRAYLSVDLFFLISGFVMAHRTSVDTDVRLGRIRN